jgi:hypothetical protein
MKSGLFFRFDPFVQPQVKQCILSFGKWLRKNTEFPKKMIVYIKNNTVLQSTSGASQGIFYAPYDKNRYPHIKIAVGDFEQEVSRYGSASVLKSNLNTIAHEIVHYQQWIQNTPFKEREAISKGENLLNQFIRDEIMLINDRIENLKKTDDKQELTLILDRFPFSVIDVCLEMIDLISVIKTRKIKEWLLSSAEDTNEYIRYQVVKGLGNFNWKDVIKVLIKRLQQDTEPFIRAHSIESLQYIGDKSIINHLIYALSDTDPDVRGCAAVALGWMDEKECLPLIREAIKKEKSPRAKLRYYVALYLLGEKWTTEKIFSFLLNRSPIVRDAAVGYIYQIPIDKSRKKQELIEMLNNEQIDWVKNSIDEVLKIL